MTPMARSPRRTHGGTDCQESGHQAVARSRVIAALGHARGRPIGRLVVAAFLLVAFAWGVRGAVADIASQPGSLLVPTVNVLATSGALAFAWLAGLALVFIYATCRGTRVAGWIRLVIVGEFFLRSQLARYIPGRVVQLALLTLSLRKHDLSRSAAVSIVASHTFQFLLAGIILAVPLAPITILNGNHPVGLPVAGAAAFAIVAAIVWIWFPNKNPLIARILDKVGIDKPRSPSTPVSRAWSLALYVTVSLLQAVSILPLVLWMTHDAGDRRWTFALAAALAYPVARVFGQASVITPGGLGAREGAFVLLTSPFLPVEVAAIVSVWVRIVAITTEVVLYALFLVGRATIRNVHITRTSDR